MRPCLERSGELIDVLHELARSGITSVLVEGGPRVADDFHSAGLVDRYVLYVANAEPADAAAAIRELWNAEVVDAVRIGHDVRVTLTPTRKA